ncbi:hypothetical protein JCM8208_005751 [Rhodotorula glutinis]
MSTSTTTHEGTDLHALLGLSPSSPQLAAFLSHLEARSSGPPPPPEVKAYSDIVYLNYRHIGLSLSFEPLPPFRPSSSSTLDHLRRQGDQGRLTCSGVDLYNHDDTARARPPDDKKKAPRQRPEDRWEPFPAYPVLLPSSSSSSTSATPSSTTSEPPTANADAPPATVAPTAPLPFPLEPSTTGAALLAHLGEPTRKGGGSSSTPGVGIWTEWTPQGLMVEWASSGLGAWEKGGESTWRCVSVFEPGKGPRGA